MQAKAEEECETCRLHYIGETGNSSVTGGANIRDVPQNKSSNGIWPLEKQKKDSR